MDLLPVVASLLQWLVGLVIGFRLVWLGVRGRRVLELTIGLSWLSAVLANFFWLLSAVVEPSTELHGAISIATRLFSSVSCGLVHLVTWWIFRRRSPWAIAFTLITLVGLGLGTARLLHFVYGWLRAVPYVWLTVEALLEQGRLRKQLRFGLEPDRTLADQMFFLAMVSLAAATSYASIVMWAAFLPALPIREISSSLSILSAVFSWLAFLPPKAYLRWARKERGVG